MRSHGLTRHFVFKFQPFRSFNLHIEVVMRVVEHEKPFNYACLRAELR